MKRLIILISITLPFSLHGQWEGISLQNVSEDIYKIEFVSNDTGFITGQGIILKTNDKGGSWRKDTVDLLNGVNQKVRLYDIHFSNNVGLCVGENGTILKTNDLRDTWIRLDSLTNETLASVFLMNNSNIWIGGTNGIILNSNDGGVNWDIINLGNRYSSFNDLIFFNDNNGLIFGGHRDPGSASSVAVILKTTDGGMTWQEVFNYGPMNSTLNETLFISEGSIISVGQNVLLKSTDNGDNWENVTSTYSFNSLSQYNTQTIYYSEYNGIVYKSDIQLQKFSQDTSFYFEDIYINDITFTQDGTGFITGTLNFWQPKLYRNNSLTNVNKEDIFPKKYKLKQNYPNPFNQNTIIQYSLAEKCRVTLKVYNILGSEITELVDDEKSIGSHEIEFNADNMPSGVYLYTFKAGELFNVKKMILMR